MDRQGKLDSSKTDVSTEAPETNDVAAPKKPGRKPGAFGKKEVSVVTIEPLKLSRCEVTLVGETPLIMHRFSEKGGLEAMRNKQWQIGDQTKKKRDAKDPIALFVAAAHTMPGSPQPKVKGTKEAFLKWTEEKEGPCPVTMTGKFAVPFAYLKGAMESAAPDVQGISKAQVRRAIRIVEEYVPLKCSQAVMREDLVRLNDMNRTADIRYRPMFIDWSLTFTVEFNSGVVSLSTVVNLLNIAGFAAGIGEWRPERSGEFGRFHVLSK